MNTYLSIVPLTAFFVYTVIITLTARQSMQQRANRLFAWYLFLLLVWAFFSFMVYANFPLMDVHFWNSLLIVPLMTASVAFFHFVCAFLEKPAPRFWLSLGYGSCLLLTVAATLGYTIDYAYWEGGAYHMKLGLATYAMTPIAVGFVNASIFKLYKERKSTKDPFRRNRITYPLIGYYLVALLSLTNYIPGWKWYPVDQGGNLFNSSLVAYVILRYKLIDFQIAFKKVFLYCIQTLVMGGILIGVGIALFAAFGAYDFIKWGYGVGIALFLAICLPLVYRLMQRRLHQLFPEEERGYRSTLTAISSVMRTMPNLEDQASWLMDNVMKTVQTTKGGLFLLDDEQRRYELKALRGYASPELSDIWLGSDNPLIGLLANSDRCLVAADLERVPQLRGLWQSEREHLKKLETEVLVPVKTSGNLIGVILLGPKRSRKMYSVDNLDLVYAVANQAAVAIENTRLYQEVKDRAEWIEMMNKLTRTIGSSLDIDQVYETLAGALKKLISFDRLSIGLIEEDKIRYLEVSSEVPTDLPKGTTIPVKKSGAAWVAACKATSIEPDLAEETKFPVDETLLREGLRAVIRVPLLAKGEVFGTLNLSSRQPHAYGERERKILEQIAGQLAVATQNALLFEQAKKSYEEAKQAYKELNAAQEYMVRAEKLRALGEMAGGVAHDFNNVLSVVLGRAQLALEDAQEPRLRKSLKAIEQAALDASKTVRRLQEFTRVRKDQDFDQVNVGQLIQSVMQMAETRISEHRQKKGVEINVTTEIKRMGSVRGDAAELREALINIIFNAIDAMPKGGALTIKGWQELNQAVISISDTGTGMSSEVTNKIFDPFFTTKGRDGVGLGLSITYGIITRHGGVIDVESKLGEGSSFYVRLPLGDGAKGKTPAAPQPEPAAKARIMLVDDDPEVSEVLELMLTQMGHNVTMVNKGGEALTQFEHGDYHLVITDLGMPDVSGWDVAKAVKEKKPEIPVVLITGWGVQVDGKEMAKSGVDGVIAKPFSKQTLCAQLAKLLNGSK